MGSIINATDKKRLTLKIITTEDLSHVKFVQAGVHSSPSPSTTKNAQLFMVIQTKSTESIM